MPHPGVIHYDPTVSQSTWYVSYIRSQESETFHLKGSYSFEISAIGQYEIDQSMGDKEYKILPEDFRRRHEIEVQYYGSTTLSVIMLLTVGACAMRITVIQHFVYLSPSLSEASPMHYGWLSARAELQ